MTKSERITALEARIAVLEARLAKVEARPTFTWAYGPSPCWPYNLGTIATAATTTTGVGVYTNGNDCYGTMT